MLGISSTLCWVSWFVYFYIWAMVVMPFAGRLIDRRPVLWTGGLMVFFFAALAAMHTFVPGFSGNDWTQALFDCLLNTLLMLMGYLFARERWYERIRIPEHWMVAVGAVVLAASVLVVKAHIGGMAAVVAELVYAPLMILSILAFFTVWRCRWLERVMAELGDKSVYMWFFHALFFTASTRPVYHRFVMVSDNLWIIPFGR